MERVADFVTGAFLLHLLTVIAPLATLVIASGLIGWRASVRLLLLGVLATAATMQLTAIITTATYARIEYGAPLAFARAAWDPETAQRITEPVVLHANLLGDMAFWCSLSVLVGAAVQWVVLRMMRPGEPRPRRRTHRRMPPTVPIRRPDPMRRDALISGWG